MRAERLILLALALAGVAACQPAMRHEGKLRPLAPSHEFASGSSALPPPEGTVARGQLRLDRHLYAGLGPDGQLATSLPFPLTAEVLRRGRERFDVYCSPCHDRLGTGNGMIVQRGYKRPPSYHNDRLRNAPIGYFFEVASHGFGVMPSYASQVPPEDRWAIAAYIRTLQISQNVPVGQLTPDQRAALDRAGQGGRR